MSYIREDFVDGRQYSSSDFNRMVLDGIDEAMKSGGSSSAYAQKQTVNMAKSLKKLRMGEQTEFCFFGDSVFYGYFKGENAVEEDCIPDKNTPYSVRYGKTPTRNPITIYDTFAQVMNQVFESNVKLKKKLYSGHTAKWAYEDYNASNSHFVILNFGINCALGAHVDAKDPLYRGDVEKYIHYMRLIIERELDAGASIIIMTPVKLTTVIDGGDTDDRQLCDVYEQACFDLGKEYNCPVIDGNEITQNLPITLSADFCHFTGDGNKTIGYRLASVFIGQSPSKPYIVHNGSYLSMHPQLCNANIVLPATISYSNLSPNIAYHISSGNLVYPVVRVEDGIESVVTNSGKVVWSFYCPSENMVVVPNMYTTDVPNIAMRLDFGAKQGKLSNYWTLGNTSSTTIDRNHEVATEVVYNSASDMTTWGVGCCNGIHTLSREKNKAIVITTKGWHTIEIAIKPKEVAGNPTGRSNIPEDFGDGAIHVYGLNFLSLEDYNRKVQV